MEVGFRKVYVSPYNLSFCIYSANMKVYSKKAMLELFFVVRVFLKGCVYEVLFCFTYKSSCNLLTDFSGLCFVVFKNGN